MNFDTKELRSYHAWEERAPNQDLELLRKAADHIDAQASEIERLREALRWTAGALQSACQSAYCSAEDDRVTIGDETKTVSKILDYADAALSGEPT